jgi:hypothetical protein
MEENMYSLPPSGKSNIGTLRSNTGLRGHDWVNAYYDIPRCRLKLSDSEVVPPLDFCLCKLCISSSSQRYKAILPIRRFLSMPLLQAQVYLLFLSSLATATQELAHHKSQSRPGDALQTICRAHRASSSNHSTLNFRKYMADVDGTIDLL